MTSTSYNSGYSTGVNPSGIWRAYVHAVDADTISVTVPRLGQGNVYKNVPFTGGSPVVGQQVWVGFIEGRSSTPVAFIDIDAADNDLDLDGDLTIGGSLTVAGDITGGTNFNLTGNALVGGHVETDAIYFDTDAAAVAGEGQMAWNDDEGTIDIGMHRSNVVLQVGQETVYYVKNQTGSTITNGTVVRFDGSLGASGRLKVAPFLADGTYRSAYLMGIATEDIPDGEDGYVTHFGKVRNLNTTQDSEGNTLVDGDLLYASATVTGGYTKIEPSAPNNRILLAAVVKAHAQQGTLFVRPAFPTSLLDNEAVNAPSIADNDVLVYNGTTEVFENVPFDHGGLTGLGDDDHTQYLLADGSRAANSLSVSGSLTVDTNTLSVDATNNRVGVGTTSPDYRLDVNAGVDSDLFRLRGADDSLIFSVSNGDFYIKNDQQNNGLVIYDGAAGVEILYDNTAVFEADSGGVKANGEIIWHDTGWTAATLQNSWTIYTGRRTPRYRKIGDEVFVEGEVDGGTITAGTTVFTLPSGYRPPQAFVVPIASAGVASGQSARFYVLTTGAVTIYGVTSNADIAFNFCFSTI